MRALTTTLMTLMLLGGTAMMTVGCREKGPAEKAGEAIDDAFDGDGALEDVGENVDDAVDDVKDGVEDAAEEIEDGPEAATSAQ